VSFGRHDVLPEAEVLLREVLGLGPDVPAEAERVLREAVKLRGENLPPEHFMAALTQGALGEMLLAQRRFGAVEPRLLASYESLKRSQATENPRVGSARNRLIALYTAWNKPDKLARLQ
jgi:hypothetical protein